ncbi:MAG: hypothetical protein L6427_08875, partial [Actinomycetia bacterium]|nr:hypothetical protein [Actinomycetes bacterium]
MFLGSKLKGQLGFSMAEVVIAIALFVASTTGIAAMLISGGSNVTRGAKESRAANLAADRIEEVKALPFYVPYNTLQGNRDIDDYYWVYNGATPRPNSEQFQVQNPNEETSIPGYVGFRRTTAVQYQYVTAGVPPSGGQLEPAVMNTNWRPKNAVSPQFDRPTGGPLASSMDVLRGLIIQVKVYNQTDPGEKCYTVQGLAGDLMITGGT